MYGDCMLTSISTCFLSCKALCRPTLVRDWSSCTLDEAADVSLIMHYNIISTYIVYIVVYTYSIKCMFFLTLKAAIKPSIVSYLKITSPLHHHSTNKHTQLYLVIDYLQWSNTSLHNHVHIGTIQVGSNRGESRQEVHWKWACYWVSP